MEGSEDASAMAMCSHLPKRFPRDVYSKMILLQFEIVHRDDYDTPETNIRKIEDRISSVLTATAIISSGAYRLGFECDDTCAEIGLTKMIECL